MNEQLNPTPPIIALTEYLFSSASEQAASDIHIEPYDNQYRVRMRCQTLLKHFMLLEQEVALQLINRLKILASLNVAEKRFPQDGHIKPEPTQTYTVRINITPTWHGEKVVLRFLNSNKNRLTVETLQFNAVQQKMLLKAIHQPHGLILLTGPTGCGKSTTLYAILDELNVAEKNIATVEDPVEMSMLGLTQCHVNSAIGIEFDLLLRALLRQDPDILMIGEIRDSKTAQIALQASQTGHLVLSTLHTSHPLEAIERLCNLGLPRESVTNAINLIITQRLIRRLCMICKLKEPYQAHHAFLKNHRVYQAVGCEHCQQGYSDKKAIFEMVPFDSLLRKKLMSHSFSTIELIPPSLGLREQLLTELMAGNTSLAEFYRVLGED